jgi:hypothetical protein
VLAVARCRVLLVGGQLRGIEIAADPARAARLATAHVAPPVTDTPAMAKRARRGPRQR